MQELNWRRRIFGVLVFLIDGAAARFKNVRPFIMDMTVSVKPTRKWLYNSVDSVSVLSFGVKQEGIGYIKGDHFCESF
jgi:hypothetical protein